MGEANGDLTQVNFIKFATRALDEFRPMIIMSAIDVTPLVRLT